MKNPRRWSAGHRTRCDAATPRWSRSRCSRCWWRQPRAAPVRGCRPSPGTSTRTTAARRAWRRSAPPGRPVQGRHPDLPNDASQQREQLVRRLAAQDSSIDLMSLDPPFVAEFANAGFLRAFDKADAGAADQGRARRPAEDGVLERQAGRGAVLGQHPAAVVPQVGGRRPPASTPTSPDFTWDEMIKAAVEREQGHRRPGEPLRGLHGVDQRPGRLGAVGRSSPTSTRARTPLPRSTRRPATQAARSSGSWPGRRPRRRRCRPPPRRRPVGVPGRPRHVHGQLALRLRRRPGRREDRRHQSQSSSTTSAGPGTPRSIAGKPSKPPLGGINLAIGDVHQVPEPGRGAGQVHHLVGVQRAVHGRLGKPGGQGRGLRRPGSPQGVPDGGPDPRVHQRRRAAAGHAVLQRRLHLGPAHWHPPATCGRRRRRRRHRTS